MAAATGAAAPSQRRLLQRVAPELDAVESELAGAIAAAAAIEANVLRRARRRMQSRKRRQAA
ncbi:hypothetical protein, partial [Listeria monocytogenes]|uniref:hypothetical protein n=1 Tax=Listeria monocytogenes TaxID=1639 RepID=UPI002FDC02A9